MLLHSLSLFEHGFTLFIVVIFDIFTRGREEKGDCGIVIQK